MDREELIMRGTLLTLLFILATIVVVQQQEVGKNNKVEKEIVDQYCQAVHKYSVPNYLTCKDNDAQTILINLTDEAGTNLSKVPKKELEEAVKNK